MRSRSMGNDLMNPEKLARGLFAITPRDSLGSPHAGVHPEGLGTNMSFRYANPLPLSALSGFGAIS